ncbi:MAG TPA: hypothetical protein VN924_16020 [Bryobacteraceae bacterium]|nr:hypothetical protein [Bryobacteraceae bacterium]
MKKYRQDNVQPWTNDPGIAARYAPIHGMVTKLLTKTDPHGYARLLEDFRGRYKPEGVEVRLVEFMADLSWRTSGCFALETEILRQGMAVCAHPQDTPDQSLAPAYIRDFEGADLLDKLSRYERRLSSELSRCIRVLELRAKNRKYAEARMADTLARHKPCTSVIQ